MWDLGEYRKCKIRVSTGKGRIRASIGNVGSGRVPGRWDPAEYREGGIRPSTGKVGSERVPEMGNPGEMLENPKQAKRSKQTQGKGVDSSMTSRVYQKMTRISQKSNTIMTKEGGCPNMTT